MNWRKLVFHLKIKDDKLIVRIPMTYWVFLSGACCLIVGVIFSFDLDPTTFLKLNIDFLYPVLFVFMTYVNLEIRAIYQFITHKFNKFQKRSFSDIIEGIFIPLLALFSNVLINLFYNLEVGHVVIFSAFMAAIVLAYPVVIIINKKNNQFQYKIPVTLSHKIATIDIPHNIESIVLKTYIGDDGEPSIYELFLEPNKWIICSGGFITEWWHKEFLLALKEFLNVPVKYERYDGWSTDDLTNDL